MEVRDTVQEAVIKTISKKKKRKKAKWLSEEALQIAEKRKEAKAKEESKDSNESHLNTEFQRIAQQDKKAFLSDQCKEIEENNTMGKTRKGQFSFQSQRKAMPKNAQTTAQLHASHMLVKSCSKFSKPGFSNT